MHEIHCLNLPKSQKMSAYIYERVRTPRGKGKPDGALASVKPVDSLASTFQCHSREE